MHHFSPARWLVIVPVAAAVLAAAAHAQTPDPDASPDAQRPAQAAPTALSYRSALEGFQSFADEKAVPWKLANDTVHQRGGWKAYAKEASEANPATSAHSSARHAHGEGAHTMPSGASMSMPMAPRKGQP
ncbi:MAG: hypothetical protein EOP13_31115 [Pseudomonas sp.]|uniref:hypothetical protein n=1 Tax=Pseudomonas sp. TaxID=306 RepID=UPI00120086DC|nr:hypothetical protein [Pseudomonas sp.]RZI66043.1 MAG: hypothetical protein EOP13_31115 [Pseudomonas sp.]